MTNKNSNQFELVGIKLDDKTSYQKQINFLGITNLVKDLKSIPNWFKCILLIGMVVMMFFSFFSIETFNPTPQELAQLDPDAVSQVQMYFGSHFSPLMQYAKSYLYGSPIGNPGKTLALVTAILYSVNGIAGFTGLLSVATIIYGKTSQFFWGLTNGVFYSMFALVSGFVGDFIMNLIFILGAPLGWYLFQFKHKGQKTLRGQIWWKKIIYPLSTLLIIVGLCFAWYNLIPVIYESMFKIKYELSNFQHLFDGVANGVNTTGYTLQLLNVSEQFWIWTFLNIWKLLMFTPAVLPGGNYSITMILQFGVWIILGGIGLWTNQLKYIFAWMKLKFQKV